MRNNQDRFGATTEASSPPVPEAYEPKGNSQPTLQFVAPTEVVDLPSKGHFYPVGHPLHNKDTIEIRFMTAKDEDILTSTTLLKKGLAIDRLLQNIIVDKTINVEDLLIGDKNAVLIASRITGYGASYDAKVMCPVCSSNVEYSFDLTDIDIKEPIDFESWGVQVTANKTFIIHLEKSDVDVEFRLLTGKDERTLANLMEVKKKKKLPESNLTDQLRMMIVSVNGSPEQNYINSYVSNMPAIDSRVLRTTYQNLIPNVNLSQGFTCSGCGFDGEVDMPFGASFFWPK